MSHNKDHPGSNYNGYCHSPDNSFEKSRDNSFERSNNGMKRMIEKLIKDNQKRDSVIKRCSTYITSILAENERLKTLVDKKDEIISELRKELNTMEDRLFEAKKEADLIDHYKALENKLKREIEKLISENQFVKDDVNKVLMKKDLDLEKHSKVTERISLEKAAIYDEINNLKTHNKQNNTLIEEYVLDIRNYDRKNQSLQEENDNLHKKIDQMKDYHSKEVRLITNQARQFVRDVNENALSSNCNANSQVDQKSFKFDLETESKDAENVFNITMVDDSCYLLNETNTKREVATKHSRKSSNLTQRETNSFNYKNKSVSNIKQDSMINNLTIAGDSITGPGYENPREQQGDFVLIPRSEDTIKNFNVAMLRDQNIISTSLLISINKEFADLNVKNHKYLQPFLSKADRKDGTEFKYYIQVILKSLEEKDLRIKELVKSEKELENMVLDYQKVFRNYEDLRKNQTNYYRSISGKMKNDLNSCIEFYKGYASDQVGDANIAAENFEKKYFCMSEVIKDNIETIFSDIVLYSNEFTETFNDVDIEDFEPIDNEIKELNTLKDRFNDIGNCDSGRGLDIIENQEEKLESFHKSFAKKIEIMSRMWKSSKS